jgi:hypothetical protein
VIDVRTLPVTSDSENGAIIDFQLRTNLAVTPTSATLPLPFLGKSWLCGGKASDEAPRQQEQESAPGHWTTVPFSSQAPWLFL